MLVCIHNILTLLSTNAYKFMVFHVLWAKKYFLTVTVFSIFSFIDTNYYI